MDEDKPPPFEDRINSEFRNGSVTAIGVVLAFSLGFLATWTQLPTTWLPEDLIAVIVMAVGIGFQIWAMAGMLSTGSMLTPVYRRIVRRFLIGLILIAVGVVLSVGADALGIRPEVP